MKIVTPLPDSTSSVIGDIVNLQYQSRALNFTDQFGERTLCSYLQFTPVLWALGLLTPLGAIILLYLVFRKANWKKIGFVGYSWWLVGTVQAISVVVNWADADLPLSYLFYRLGGATVSGWFFIGAAIGAGKIYGFASKRVVRAVCVIGLYLLTFGSVSLVIAFALGIDDLVVPSPLAFFFPDDLPFVTNSLTMRFIHFEETMESTIPRLILFYPWSVCLSFAGISVFMIARQDSDRLWQLIGMSGGLLGIVGSMSRAGIFAFLVACAVYGWLRLPKSYRFAAFVLTGFVGIILVAIDASLIDLVSRLFASMTEVREGSSEARQLGYDESWEGFLRSPVFGYGWPGDNLSETIPMPIGTHSSVYGTLYTGGILTFLTFCFAMTTTLFSLYIRAIPYVTGSCVALSIIAALAIFCYGEGIQSFAIPVLFAFCWLGGSLNQGSYTSDD